MGQYQNGDIRLGALFTTSEVLLAASMVTSGVLAQAYANYDRSICTSDECLAGVEAQFKAATLVNRISFGALIGVAIAGIVQAQIAFVPERVTQIPRAIPPRPKIAPTISMDPKNLGVGLVGQF